jgi:hypothetical protein
LKNTESDIPIEEVNLRWNEKTQSWNLYDKQMRNVLIYLRSHKRIR